MNPNITPEPEDQIGGRADEIQHDIASGDGDRAVNRLLDFAKDFGTRKSLKSAILLSGRYGQVRRQIRDHGTSDSGTSKLHEILDGVLDLVDEIVDNPPRVASKESGPSFSEHSPARQAFETDVTREADKHDDVVLRVLDLGLVRRREDPRFALTNISLELRSGEILALVGANGQGKSTLLEAISGRLRHDSGVLEYPMLDREWSHIKRHISYMPQTQRASAATSEVALRYTAGLYGALGEDNDLAVDYSFERLGLTKYRTVDANSLSRGYQVRFGLARALLKRPRLLLLDEPLAHLDLPTQSRFLGDIRDLSRSPTNPFAAVISSQHLHEVEAISNKTLVLLNGRTRFYGLTAMVGHARSEELFELSCDCDGDSLQRGLSILGHCTVERSGPKFVIRLPLGVSSECVLKQLLQSSIRVSYFRVIGKSAVSILEPGK